MVRIPLEPPMNLKTAVLASTLWLSACHSAQQEFQEPQEPPNILFIYSDDHATAAVGCYDNSVVAGHAQTPHIDALARDGIRFDRAFCTNGICAPARAVVLTGKHSHLNGVPDNGASFDGSQRDLPQATAGKWLSDGFDWEVAFEKHTDGIRPLGSPPRARPVLRPRFSEPRAGVRGRRTQVERPNQEASHRRLRHRSHDGPRDRVA